MTFNKWDIVSTTRPIKAGLDEKGPTVCGAGAKGYVIEFNVREPDGVHVMLESGNEWWFKPNQLQVLHDVYSLKVAGRHWLKPENGYDDLYEEEQEEVNPVTPRRN